FGQFIDALEERLTSGLVKDQLFCCHNSNQSFVWFLVEDRWESNELLDHGEDIVGAEDLVFLAVEFDLGSAVFADEDAVALLNFERDLLAVVIGLAGAEGDDNAFGRLFFSGIRNDDATFFDFFLFGGFDEDAIAERFQVRASHIAFFSWLILIW